MGVTALLLRWTARSLLVAIGLLLLTLVLSSAKALPGPEKTVVAQPACWTQVAPLSQYGLRKLWASPSDPQRLFAGWYRTLDGGQTWSSYPSFDRVNSMAFAPNGVFYAGGAYPGGFYSSADGGATWTLAPQTPGSRGPPLDDMVVDPRDPDIIYGADHSDGIGAVKSTDGGRTWRVVKQGLEPRGCDYSGVENMVIDPRTPDILYATNNSTAGLYKTTNGAEQWFKVASPISTGDLAIVPANPSVLFVTGERGTWRTRDGGITGTQVAPGAGVIAFNPLNSNQIYLGGSTTPVRRSLDGGDSWEDFSAGLAPMLGVYSLAFRLANPPELWAGTGNGLYKYVFPPLNVLYFPSLVKGSAGP